MRKAKIKNNWERKCYSQNGFKGAFIKQRIEKSVEDESFDLAAELDEKVLAARSDIEALGFSVDELEEAVKNRSGAVEINGIHYEGGEQLEDAIMNGDAEKREDNDAGEVVETDAGGEDG